MKPILFILNMPFEDDPGEMWFCSHCALIEGALKANPDWNSVIDVRRIYFPKPRAELMELLGKENQWLPVLVLGQGRTITDPIGITKFIALEYGGAAPHP